MLRNNNSDIDIAELNRRISDQVERYKLSPKRLSAASFKRSSAADKLKAISVAELMERNDEAFVREAYKLILGREVDANGLTHYLSHVRAGGEKAEVIAALCCSAEGRPNSHLFPAARRYWFKSRLSKLPLVGEIFSHFFSFITVRPFRRYVNSRFNAMSAQGDGCSLRIGQLERQVEVLVQHQLAQKKQWDLFSGEMQDQLGRQRQQIEAMDLEKQAEP